MSIDPRRIADSKDAWVNALYAKTVGETADDDVLPLVIDSNGFLLVNMTVGTVTLTGTKVTVDNTVTVTGTVTTSAGSTASTITNAVGNPANVALTSTKVTIESASGFNVNVATATLGTVTITGTVTPSTTASTITNAAGNPVNVSLTATAVTASLANSGVTISIGRTLTGSTGTLSATNGTISLTPSGRIKVYAISLTTTSASEVMCVFNSGGVANGLELWRATLMAPAGANSGLNLAVTPPAFLFASRSGTAVSLSLSSAVLVHYSLSYFDEA